MNVIIKRRILVWTSVLFVSIFLMAQTAVPQTNTGLTRTTDVWRVDYHVSVTGDFSKEPELGDDGPSIFYHIKREYTGRATLVYLPKTGDPKSATLYPQFKDPTARVRIKIDDLIRTIYPVICDEYQSKEESWHADVDSLTGDQTNRYPALLMIYNDQLRYKTSFPILYLDTGSTFKGIEHKTVEFKNPGRKETRSNFERLGFTTHQFPSVKGYIEHDSIIRSPWWAELNETDGTFSWLSPILHPDVPLIDDIPESKDKVNILIHYAFTKVKG
jgi:hypothetical protein